MSDANFPLHLSHRLQQRREHRYAKPLNSEPDQLDPRPILSLVVSEPVLGEDVLLDLAGANASKAYDDVGFDIEGVARLINLLDDHVTRPMVAIGKGTKEAWTKPGQLTLDEVTVNNGF